MKIDTVVSKIMESPFTTEGDRMLALSFLHETLTKCRVNVDKSSLEEATCWKSRDHLQLEVRHRQFSGLYWRWSAINKKTFC